MCLCTHCPEEFRHFEGGACYTQVRKVLGSPRHFCSSWTNISVIEEAEWCEEAGVSSGEDVWVVGGAGLVLRALEELRSRLSQERGRDGR